MTTEQLVKLAIEALNHYGADYMLIGSLATNFYGVPRSTQDADIVVGGDLLPVARAIASSNDDFRLDPQIGFETVTATRRVIVNSLSNDFLIELFQLSNDAHDVMRFQRRRHAAFAGNSVWVASPQDTA